MSIFAISDIHGCYNELMSLMKKIKIKNDDTLLFLGDYIDRGPDSRKVVEWLFNTKKIRPNTFLLKGNHESLAYDALFDGENYVWIVNGGDRTAMSYGSDDDLLRNHVSRLNSLPSYFIKDKYFFSHAGVNLHKDIDHQNEDNLLWDRDFVFSSKKSKIEELGYTIVFGHTPLESVCVSYTKICIDTGVCFGGKLSCIQLPELIVYEEPKQEV